VRRSSIPTSVEPDDSRELWSAIAGAAVTTGLGIALAALWTPVDLAVSVLIHLSWSAAFLSWTVRRKGLWQRMDGTPLRRIGMANHLTLARIYLLPALVFLVWSRAWPEVVTLFLFVGLTDIADGILARRGSNTSKLGYVLDPLGDMMFNLSMATTLTLRDALPAWVGILALLRYSILLMGAAVLLLRHGELRVGPTRLGKLTGLVIGGSLLLVLIHLAWVPGLRQAAGIAQSILGIAFAIGVAQAAHIGWDRLHSPIQGAGQTYRRGGELSPVTRGTPEDPAR
jgi:cardiolipin synthase